ncbi:MAG: Rieske 2Fe-2S domain-containing protein [Anaerolineae bacterium]|nr:Rieske 2Fe-2S domain-containing protein [Anaerolineae bacterium]
MTLDNTPPAAPSPARRDFLEASWLALGGLAVLGAGYIGLRFVGSSLTDSAFGGVIIAGRLEEIPPGTVTAFPLGQFFLVRNAEGGLLALYRKCTHLDCVVTWNATRRRFNCPCHGSQFTEAGAVLNLPAPRPLSHFAVIVEEGLVRVDTSQLIERSTVQAEDWAYPPPAEQP